MNTKLAEASIENRSSRGLEQLRSRPKAYEKPKPALRIPDCERYVPGGLCLNGNGQLLGKCLRGYCSRFSSFKDGLVEIDGKVYDAKEASKL